MRTGLLARWSALVGGLVLFSGSLAAGCTCICCDNEGWWDEGVKETRTILLDHVAGKPVHVQTQNGAVSLEKGSDASVSITAKVRAQTDERLKATKVVAKRLDDGTLDVQVQWPDEKRQNNEGVSLEIKLPDAVGINIEATNGPIAIGSMGGKAILATSNGPVTVKGHAGPVDAQTSNAPVKIEGANSELLVKTSNAPVKIKDALGPVKVKTSNGPIDIELRSESTGPVECKSSNGPIKLTVGSAFAGTLKADTSNGGVRVHGVEESRMTVKKSSAKVRFTDAGPESSLDTSNAPIEITRQ